MVDPEIKAELRAAQQHLLSAVQLVLNNYRDPAVIRHALNVIRDTLQAVNALDWMIGKEEDE